MKTWKKILLSILMLWLLWTSFAQVQFEPVYTSERFQPSDMYHANCENQLNLIFAITWSEVNWVNAILNYNPNDIEILKVVWENEKENNLSYVVNDDKIYFTKLKSDNGDWASKDVKFTVYFKSNEWVTDTNVFFEEGSYLVDSHGNMVNFGDAMIMQFSAVPECDPDIVAPKVSLLFPQEDSWTPLDSYFQFDISDVWKGINDESIVLSVNGIDYNITDMEYDRDKNVLTIYPDFWMPLNTWFEVKISVSDKQVYGWSNSVTKIYNLETPDELYLLNNISPIDFRKIVNSQKYYKWTTWECKFISDLYYLDTNNSDKMKKSIISSINKKLSCPDLWDTDREVISTENKNSLSALSVISWIVSWLLLLIIILMSLKTIWKKSN